MDVLTATNDLNFLLFEKTRRTGYPESHFFDEISEKSCIEIIFLDEQRTTHRNRIIRLEENSATDGSDFLKMDVYAGTSGV